MLAPDPPSTHAPRMPYSDQRPWAAAKRTRTALCGTAGGAPGTTEAGPARAAPDAPQNGSAAVVYTAVSADSYLAMYERALSS